MLVRNTVLHRTTHTRIQLPRYYQNLPRILLEDVSSPPHPPTTRQRQWNAVLRFEAALVSKN